MRTHHGGHGSHHGRHGHRPHAENEAARTNERTVPGLLTAAAKRTYAARELGVEVAASAASILAAAVAVTATALAIATAT